MVIRHSGAWLLAATIAGGTVLTGCHYACRRCNDPCPEDDCRYGSTDAGVVYPTPAYANGYAAGNPSGPQAGRVPFPQSREVIQYREPTLLERMKLGLRRMNPLSRSESPAVESTVPASAPAMQPVPEKRLPYTPAPAVDESADGRRSPRSLWADDAPSGFERARIDVGNSNPAGAPRLLAQVDSWPYGPATLAPASEASPRFLNENGSAVSTAPGDLSPIRPVHVRNFH
jgi:hypothetical protein